VGARRDDITGTERAQIAIAVLNDNRDWGTVADFAAEYAISRQTVYNIAAAGKQVLIDGLEPGPHGPQPREKTICVDRNRLVRGAVVLTGEGVSQRGVPRCLSEMLDTDLSPSGSLDTNIAISIVLIASSSVLETAILTTNRPSDSRFLENCCSTASECNGDAQDK
jgi:hypothetical protein